MVETEVRSADIVVADRWTFLPEVFMRLKKAARGMDPRQRSQQIRLHEAVNEDGGEFINPEAVMIFLRAYGVEMHDIAIGIKGSDHALALKLSRGDEARKVREQLAKTGVVL